MSKKPSPNRPAAMLDGPMKTPAQCYTGKVPYASHAEAHWHAKRSSTVQLWPYRCWNCHTYHLASRDNTPNRNRYHELVVRQTVQQENPQ
jgi:hypothetical protein